MPAVATDLLCPFDLGVDTMAGLLNAEFVDHPVYDGFELQWFDDPTHGTGMLAFLSRRSDRRVDYYQDPRLTLDRANYAIGGGTGQWTLTDFEVARFHLDDNGLVAHVAFTDIDGRRVEVEVDDRSAGPRQAATLLAPVGDGIDDPTSLMLVRLHGFDLLRRAGRPPRIRIDGQDVTIGSLPGGFLHRRHLVKAAAPVTVATVCTARSGPLTPVDPADPGPVRLNAEATGIAGLEAALADATVAATQAPATDATATPTATASMTFEPPVPPLRDLPDGHPQEGAWQVRVDGASMTGGRWVATRRGDRVDLCLEVTDRWQPPPGQPLLMRIVTRVVPVFRRWPTTYRWTAEVDLAQVPAQLTSRWERTTDERGDSYRRSTGGG